MGKNELERLRQENKILKRDNQLLLGANIQNAPFLGRMGGAINEPTKTITPLSREVLVHPAVTHPINLMIADRELRAILNQIENEMNLVMQALILVGYGIKLQIYFESERSHKTLSHLLNIFNEVVEHQHKYHIDLILPNDPALAEFNTAIREMVIAIDRFVERKDLIGNRLEEHEAANYLKGWLVQYEGTIYRRLTANLKRNIGGGRDEEKELNDALWRLSYRLWSEHGARWSLIAKKCWEAIEGKTAKSRNDDEKLVYKEWKKLDHRQRSEKIRYLWRSSGIVNTDEGEI